MNEVVPANISVSYDKLFAKLTTTDGTELLFDTVSVDSLLRMLLEARNTLLPAVSDENPRDGQNLSVIVASRVWCQPINPHLRALMLLQPGLGWIGLTVEDPLRDELVRVMTATGSG